MGEAIARFREMALSIRRHCDERHSQPRGRAVKAAAAKKFAKECCEHFLDHEKAGMNYPARYVHGLCRRRDEAERHPEPPRPGEFNLPMYIEWLPEPFKRQSPGYSETRRACREAVKEAVQWGSLFPVVEARIKALETAAEMLTRYAAPTCYEHPNKEYCGEEDGVPYDREPSTAEADRDYIARHEEFAEALDALAPFIEEQPANGGSSPKQQTSAAKQPTKRSRQGIGGRPEKFTLKFIREVVAARKRYLKDAARLRQPVQRLPEWLSDHFSEKGLPLSVLPSKDPKKPEEWSNRANRFWKAATKRLRGTETNRH